MNCESRLASFGVIVVEYMDADVRTAAEPNTAAKPNTAAGRSRAAELWHVDRALQKIEWIGRGRLSSARLLSPRQPVMHSQPRCWASSIARHMFTCLLAIFLVLLHLFFVSKTSVIYVIPRSEEICWRTSSNFGDIRNMTDGFIKRTNRDMSVVHGKGKDVCKTVDEAALGKRQSTVIVQLVLQDWYRWWASRGIGCDESPQLLQAVLFVPRLTKILRLMFGIIETYYAHETNVWMCHYCAIVNKVRNNDHITRLETEVHTSVIRLHYGFYCDGIV